MSRELIYRDDAIDAIVKCTNCNTPDDLREYVAEHSLWSLWSGGVLEALEAVEGLPPAQPDLQPTCNQLATDCISRQNAIDELEKDRAKLDHMIKGLSGYDVRIDRYVAQQDQLDYDIDAIRSLPSAEPEEVIPHRNYKNWSAFWCECGNYLGKKGEVAYCSDCGRKVNWNE